MSQETNFRKRFAFGAEDIPNIIVQRKHVVMRRSLPMILYSKWINLQCIRRHHTSIIRTLTILWMVLSRCSIFTPTILLSASPLLTTRSSYSEWWWTGNYKKCSLCSIVHRASFVEVSAHSICVEYQIIPPTPPKQYNHGGQNRNPIDLYPEQTDLLPPPKQATPPVIRRKSWWSPWQRQWQLFFAAVCHGVLLHPG